MKTLLTILVFILALPVMAQDFPICRREREVARYKALARDLTNDEASVIVNNQARIYQLRKARRNEERVACPCDNANPGLKDLIAFVEDDFHTVQQQLLGQTSQKERDDADMIARNTYNACTSRERRENLDLLNEAKLAYNSTPPAGTQAMDGFNLEGLRGFVRTENKNGKRIKTFAFAGSQTLFDWWTNATDRGGSQLKRAMRQQLDAAVAWVKGGGYINCTGHSLGGGVAEGFCAAVLRKVRYDINDFGDYQKDNRIKVVTFNGLGARDAYRHAMGTLDIPVAPDSWLTSNTIHYRVAGDPLAAHVGTPHLMGTVIERRATRIVPQLGSQEAVSFMNGVNSLGSSVASLFGQKKSGNQQQASVQYCQASDNPLAAHDISACTEIAGQANGWQVSRVDRVVMQPDI